MVTMKGRVLVGCLLVTSLVVGCKTTPPVQPEQPVVEYDRPLAAGAIGPAEDHRPTRIPDFAPGWQDLDGLKTAVRNSLNYLNKPSSAKYFPYGDINRDRMVKTLEAFLTMVDSGARSDEINGLIRATFDVYVSVGCDDKGTVLFTGLLHADLRRLAPADGSGSGIRCTSRRTTW